MKIRVWFISTLLLLFLTSSISAQSITSRNPGRNSLIAVSDFYYEGDVWIGELGNYLAKEVRQRVHYDFGNYFSVLTVEESNELLVNNGITYAWGADSEKISDVFFKRGVTLAVIGRIDKIVQTGDVDGSAEVKIVVSVSLYDVKGKMGIKTFETENSVRLEKKIREDTPWDVETARKLTSKLVFKISAYIENEMRIFQRNRSTLTI